jgi:predicted transcriptional regulator
MNDNHPTRNDNMGRPAGKSAVDLRTFLSKIVEAHRNGNNQSWVAAELGVTPAAVSLRIKALRQKGIKVPELTSGRTNSAENAADILADLGFE